MAPHEIRDLAAGPRRRLHKFGAFMRIAPCGHRLLHELAVDAYSDHDNDDGKAWRRLMKAAGPKLGD